MLLYLMALEEAPLPFAHDVNPAPSLGSLAMKRQIDWQ
jgi:hypothetical protein